MNGAFLVAGTGSNVGKSVLVAGICRWLARQGVKVAPFKAQNMALNSYVTLDGAEIGRAQAMQAAAAGVEPDAAMNPVLLKPTSDRRAQVIVLGTAVGVQDAAGYHEHRASLLPVVLDALADLRARFDVVVCEGAGSPAEINLRAGDIANMGVARAASLPTFVVGDIDRGGVFAALYGTLALLEAPDRALVRGFVINKFRGERAILDPGLDELAALTGRPVLGVLPWRDGLTVDGEDSLALHGEDSLARSDAAAAAPPVGDGLDVAVVRLPRLSNFTDLDPLAAEPAVSVRFTASGAELARADLVVVPGTKTTVDDLAWLRARGLDEVLRRRARARQPIMGICGGYQMLGQAIDDEVESGAGRVDGLGLLPVVTTFAHRKHLARRRGTCAWLGTDASGYEIRHGRVAVHGGEPLLRDEHGQPDGVLTGATLGTSWHGLLEGDEFRRALLRWVAQRRGREFTPAPRSFAQVREARLDALGNLVADHFDSAALREVVG